MKRLKMKIAVFLLVALGLSFCTDISVYAADDYPADYGIFIIANVPLL